MAAPANLPSAILATILSALSHLLVDCLEKMEEMSDYEINIEVLPTEVLPFQALHVHSYFISFYNFQQSDDFKKRV